MLLEGAQSSLYVYRVLKVLLLVKKVKEVDFCECKEVREGITAYLKHKLRSPSTQSVLVNMPIKIKIGTVHKNEKETRQRNTKTQLGTQKEEREIVVWSLRPSLPTNKLS